MGDPILFDLVDWLYHRATDWMPQTVKDRDIALAGGLGFTGAYLVTRGLQWTSKKFMNRYIPDFDEKWLPIFEKACLSGFPIALGIYGIIDPDGLKNIVSIHPTYTSGMASTYLGGSVAAVHDLQKRSGQVVLFGR